MPKWQLNVTVVPRVRTTPFLFPPLVNPILKHFIHPSRSFHTIEFPILAAKLCEISTPCQGQFSSLKGNQARPLPFLEPLLPRVIFPNFTWPQRKPVTLALEIPKIPKTDELIYRLLLGLGSSKTPRVSMLLYYPWVGIPFDNQIVPLPFGLLLKWSDGTRLEEVLAMRVARVAGFPVLKVLCYGEYLDMTHAPVSILMTRLMSWRSICWDDGRGEEANPVRAEMLSWLYA